MGSGISELGDKLGPIVWQFMPTKQFDPADFEGFLALLPTQVDGRALRHVLDVRHESFRTPEYLDAGAPLRLHHGAYRLGKVSRRSSTPRATWPTSA